MSIGRYLELIAPTRDIRESLEFYKCLGFAEISVGDIRTHHYAVISDGDSAIGLHSDGFSEPALAFVQSGLAGHARRLAEQGARFAFQHLSQETFNELGIHSPDQHLLVLMEAPTFPLAQIDSVALPVPGRIREISLRCSDLEKSIEFWEEAGCITDEEPTGDSVNLFATGLRLGLRKNVHWPEPVLRFEPADFSQTMQHLERLDIAIESGPEGAVIRSPEGIRLWITS